MLLAGGIQVSIFLQLLASSATAFKATLDRKLGAQQPGPKPIFHAGESPILPEQGLSAEVNFDSAYGSDVEKGSTSVTLSASITPPEDDRPHLSTPSGSSLKRPQKKIQSDIAATLYHFPYRPKYVAHPELGMCRLRDFKFSPEDKLGKGGFGNVYRAVHIPTGNTVALKMLAAKGIKEKPKHVENEETIHRILLHPNIGRIYCSIAEPNNNIWFVMEYFPGGNLTKQLVAYHPLPRRQMVKYVAQVILALRLIHANCIVYRDLKGENIMIDDQDNIKLIDFGLAVYDCDNSLTNLAGTLEYVAPEVAGRRNYGRASDYYSLAVLVYLLQMRRLPYRHRREGKAKFVRLLSENRLKIKPTEDKLIDSLISILANPDPTQRWKDVYENFDSFKRHPFFGDFDWNYYEDLRFW